MEPELAQQAAQLIWNTWQAGASISTLPTHCRPRDLGQGYAIQAALSELSGDTVAGWKIAATNPTGQAHIGVDSPIGGRLLAATVFASPATLPLGPNRMKVAEAEFALKLGLDLPPRDKPYNEDEVAAAIASLHPAIELPDSRLLDFANAGAAQLAADNACAHRFVLGAEVQVDWRKMDLPAHPVVMRINGKVATEGQGADVLGGPLTALAWLANSEGVRPDGLKAGQIITTGVCGNPTPVAAGDHIVVDFASFGQAELTLTA